MLELFNSTNFTLSFVRQADFVPGRQTYKEGKECTCQALVHLAQSRT